MLTRYFFSRTRELSPRTAVAAIIALTLALVGVFVAEGERAATANATEAGTPMAALIGKAGQPSVDRGIYREGPVIPVPLTNVMGGS